MEAVAHAIADWFFSLLAERGTEVLVLAVLISIWRWFMGRDLKADYEKKLAAIEAKLEAKANQPTTIHYGNNVHIEHFHAGPGLHGARLPDGTEVVSRSPIKAKPFRIGVSLGKPTTRKPLDSDPE